MLSGKKKKQNRTTDNRATQAKGRVGETAFRWDNESMTKPSKTWIILASAACFVGGGALAGQTSNSTQQPSTPQKPSATSASRPAGAKPGATAKRAATPPAPLKTQKEKASYALGLNIAKGLEKDGVDVDPESLARGLRDALSGAKPLLSDQEAQATLSALAGELRTRQEAKLEALSAPNRKAGAEYLASNKSKEGVTELPSGLQYKVLKEGSGPKPTVTDRVVCNYRGTLIDGTEFDSSYKRGEPATFAVNQVIRGWTEALQLMPVGSKWQLYLPADLAYGNQGAGKDIAPGSTLVFEVELLSIASKPESK